jgi:streptogramin lyase
MRNMRSLSRAASMLVALCALDACGEQAQTAFNSGGAGSGAAAGATGTAGSSESTAGFGGSMMPPAGGMGGMALPPDPSVGGLSSAGAGGALSGGADGVGGQSAGAGGNTDVPSGKYNHRVLLGSGLGPIAIVSDSGEFEWQIEYKPLGGEGNDALLLPSGNIAFAFKTGAEEVTPAKTVVWRFDAPSGGETQGITALPDGHFMVGEAHGGGIAYLRELDATGKVVNSITVNSGNASLGSHGQFREIRKTPQGTYLVTYLSPNKARELDATGKMIREFPCGSFVAVRLPDGNTLISCGNSHRVIEVDPQNKIVWDANNTNVPLMNGFAAGIQRLPNGNTAMCSFPGELRVDPKTTRCFEVTRDFKVVWELKTPKMPDYFWTSLELLDPAAQVGGVALR